MKLSKIMMATTALTLATGASAIDLTVVSWGGAYQNSQQKAYSEPYTAENADVSFIWDESSADAVPKLRAMSEAQNVTWDLVDVVAADAIRLCDEGLARTIDVDTELADGADGSKASADFEGLLVSECFVPQIVYSTTWGFRDDIAEWNGETPSELCDVFDLEKFPGKRAIQASPLNNMEWGAYCSGTPTAEIYDVLATEEGQQMALDKWSTIKDELVFWNAGADTPQLLSDGEVVMGSAYNGRLFSLIVEKEAPVSMLWDAQVYDLDGWIVPADLPAERDAAVMAFLSQATDTQRLADQAAYISYGPARKSSAPLVGNHKELGIDMAPHMPTDPANATNVILPNYGFWADYRDDIDAKWQAWLAQ